METISFKEARDHLADIANNIIYGHKRYTLTRRHNPVLVMISYNEWNRLKKFAQMMEDYDNLAEAEKGLKEIQEKGGISLEQFKKEIGL